MKDTKAHMMKALVYEGPRRMNVREEPVPAAGVGKVYNPGKLAKIMLDISKLKGD